MTTLTAQKRDMNEKAKKLRREGFVPGVVVGKEIKEMYPIQIAEKDAAKLMRDEKRGNQIVLQVGDDKMNVVIKDISYNALKKQVEIIDFQALVKGEKIHTAVEIVLKNEELAEGTVTQELSEIHYRADSDHLVDTIVFDFEQLKDVKVMRVEDLPMAKDEAITIQTPLDAVIFSITEHAIEEDEDDADAQSNTTEA